MALVLGSTWTQDPGRGLVLLTRVKVLATANDTFTLDAPVKHGGAVALGKGSSTAPAFATATATFTSQVADADTVTIAGRTYTFETGSVDTAYEVDVGGDLATSIQNLQAAINDTGTEGSTYGSGTVEHPFVRASSVTATTLVITAKQPGAAGNQIVVAATSPGANSISWGTVSGGAGPSVSVEPDANGDLVTVVIDDGTVNDELEIVTVHDAMANVNTTETR